MKITNLEESLKEQSILINRLQDKSNDSEQYPDRNWLRLFGVEEKVGESTDDIVLSIAKDKLGVSLNRGDIDRCHRTGPSAKDRSTNRSHADPSPGTTPVSTPASSSASWASITSSSSRKQTAPHRPIIIKFATYRMRQAVLKARRRLKETGLTIVEDLTKSN